MEVQRAELVMNLNKPKKDTLIGLGCQSDALCAVSVTGMPRMLSGSLFLWERLTIDIAFFFPLSVAKVAGIISSVPVYLNEPTSAMTNWWWGQECQGGLWCFWSLVQKSCRHRKSPDLLHVHCALRRFFTAAVGAISYWTPFTWLV